MLPVPVPLRLRGLAARQRQRLHRARVSQLRSRATLTSTASTTTRPAAVAPIQHSHEQHQQQHHSAYGARLPFLRWLGGSVVVAGFGAAYASYDETAAHDSTHHHTHAHHAHQHNPADHHSHAAAASTASAGNYGNAAIPNSAPEWVKRLAANPAYMYQDLQRLLDTTGHLIFDSLLHSPQGVSQFYYFAEMPPSLVRQLAEVDNQQTDHPSRVPPEIYKQALQAEDSGHAHVASPADLSHAVISKINRNISAVTKQTHSNNKAASDNDLLEHHLSDWTPEIRAVFRLGDSVCGHKGIVHGGMSATLMDEVSGCAAFMAVGPAFTASLTVDYLSPLPAHKWVLVRAKVLRQEGRKSYVAASIEDGEGKVFCRSSALFVKPRLLSMPPSALLAAVQ